MKSKLNVIFMGSGLYGSSVLNSLDLSKIDILYVFTKYSKVKSRNLREENFSNIEMGHLTRVSRFSEDTISLIRKANPDLIIVASFGLLLPESILNIPKFGVINVHPSLLPKYRGPSPIVSSIIDGIPFTGVTIMKMVKELDAGPIIEQKKITLDSNINSNELGVKLFRIGAEILNRLFDKIIQNQHSEIEQDHSQATFTSIIDKRDGKIKWEDGVDLIYRKFKAYNLWPGTYTYWDEKRLIFNDFNIKRSDVSKNDISKVLALKDGKLIISANGGYICVSNLQIEGKKSLQANAFVNGRPNIIGTYLS
tara:strand:+ start:652 stop:1578 length:927 start_codon:yes stop_codon:yes gene_type:complete